MVGTATFCSAGVESRCLMQVKRACLVFDLTSAHREAQRNIRAPPRAAEFLFLFFSFFQKEQDFLTPKEEALVPNKNPMAVGQYK